ncbi:unnamed protein product [Pleuronectes platessa]|uniref:Uncharacterized protein n=1 Tax=Pleuronectes platessa TaxID=8262 RepID=A0A9N7YY92_PLEPL|nr:unnamed protein product [Pleuronectes platessa]
MCPGPYLTPLPVAQLCCLRLWAGLQLYQTGNLRVALVIQASPCLIPHKQTLTTPHPHHHHTPRPPTPPLYFQPTTLLRIPFSHWPDSCSFTTPPRPGQTAGGWQGAFSSPAMAVVVLIVVWLNPVSVHKAAKLQQLMRFMLRHFQPPTARPHGECKPAIVARSGMEQKM